jgi:hypothetical protein
MVDGSGLCSGRVVHKDVLSGFHNLIDELSYCRLLEIAVRVRVINL